MPWILDPKSRPAALKLRHGQPARTLTQASGRIADCLCLQQRAPAVTLLNEEDGLHACPDDLPMKACGDLSRNRGQTERVNKPITPNPGGIGCGLSISGF